MISYKCNGGRLGENISFLYGIFRFAKINGISFDQISIPLYYSHKPLIRGEQPQYIFKENIDMFSDISFIFKEYINYDDYIDFDLRGEYDIAHLYNYYRYNKNVKNTLFRNYWSLTPYWVNKGFDIELLNYICRPKKIVDRLYKKFDKELIKSVGIHIRRKDFTVIQDNSLLINGLDYNYYYNGKKIYSVNNILSMINDIKKVHMFHNILIFSDDISWCKNNINDDTLIYVEGNRTYEDMILMSLCDYVVPNPGSFFSLVPSIFNRFREVLR